jgi:hypothetical protein
VSSMLVRLYVMRVINVCIYKALITNLPSFLPPFPSLSRQAIALIQHHPILLSEVNVRVHPPINLLGM